MRSVSIEPRTNEDSVTKQTLGTRYIVPRTSAKVQNSLRLAVDGLDEVTARADRFDAPVKEGKFQDPAERQFVREVIPSHTSPRDTIEEWLKVNPPIPRSSDIWDLPGGLCSAAALRLMCAVGVPVEARPQQRRDGRHGPRGPRDGNLDEVCEEGLAIVSDLLDAPYDECDFRTLRKANLEKLYVLLTGEWYPAQQSHAWFVRKFDPLIAP